MFGNIKYNNNDVVFLAKDYRGKVWCSLWFFIANDATYFELVEKLLLKFSYTTVTVLK